VPEKIAIDDYGTDDREGGGEEEGKVYILYFI
jgi:hypothetical protein